MQDGLKIGYEAELTWTAGPSQVIHLGATGADGGAVVFCTPAMIDLMEHAARKALEPFLEDGEESVGSLVNVEHLAATPIGSQVRGVAKVTAIEGRLIDFEIQAHDAVELIGRGTHRRAVVRTNKLAARVKEKAVKMPANQGAIPPMSIGPDSGELPRLKTLSMEIRGPLAILTLNRPDQLNAVDVRMTGDFEKALAWLGGHEEVRVVIITGAGRAFCAGDDVKEVGTLSLEQAELLSLRQARMYLAMERLPQIFIAAVNGSALGAGCVLAYSCDLRIAATIAEFGMPEILLGWAPGYGVAQLTALVGKGRALELCLTGKRIAARQALEIGLIHDVVPGNRLMSAAANMAQELLATPPIALRETKRLIHADEGPGPKSTHLADTAAYIRCLNTADAREGIEAFKDKRQAKFEGQ